MINIRYRYLFLYFMVVSSIAPVLAQDVPGSSIISRTFLSPDGARKAVQRVYDNGLGDIVQEIRSFTGPTLPSVVDLTLGSHYRSCLYDQFGRPCVQGTCNGGNQNDTIFSVTLYASGWDIKLNNKDKEDTCDEFLKLCDKIEKHMSAGLIPSNEERIHPGKIDTRLYPYLDLIGDHFIDEDKWPFSLITSYVSCITSFRSVIAANSFWP